MAFVVSLGSQPTIFLTASSGFSYLVDIPSRCNTAAPPNLPIAIAKSTSTTPSIEEAIIGTSNLMPPISHEVSTSLGFIVSSPGTSATSSKP